MAITRHREGPDVLYDRVRLGLRILVLAVLTSAASDAILLGGVQVALHTVQALQVATLLLLHGLCRRRPAWTASIAAVGLTAICATTAVNGILTADDDTIVLLLGPLLIASAALLPWSTKHQAIVVLAALASIAVNVHAVAGGLPWSPGYPQLVAVVITLTASVYIADLLERGRTRAAAVERARASAEEALQRAYAHLERRVEERTEEIRQANLILQREIAERRRAEDAARLHQAELAHVSRLATTGRMAAEIAHELNQPLAAIAAYAQGCVRRLDAGPDTTAETLRPAVEEIAAQALRAGEVLRRMTAFARERSPHYVIGDLREVIREACRFLEPEMAIHGVTAELELADEPLAVEMEPLQIEQVVVNLMRNAFEAMAACDRRSLWIRVARVEAGDVEVRIRDSGCGISPQTAAHVFQPFFTTKADGLGLGLPVSRSIIEAHGGRLWLSLGEPPGSCFRFTLPIAPATATALSAPGARASLD